MSARGTEVRALRALARSYGVQLSFRDGTGKIRRARPSAVLAVTKALGAEIDHVRDAPAALRARSGQIDRPAGRRVLVAWDGVLPDSVAAGRELCLEDGTEVRASDGERVPLGYHQMADGDLGCNTLVISAPRTAPEPPRGSWGIFLPLYALRTDRGWGIGDLTDLENVMRWVTKLGGNLVATLPLQATYLCGPVIDHSPYSPVSRLFYNELYVDPQRTPEFEGSDEARQLVASEGFRHRVAEVRRGDFVDHEAVYAVKRQVLEVLARRFFSGPRRDDLRRFLHDEALALDHARFRAHMERSGRPDPRWRVPHEVPTDAAEQYHLYTQLIAHEQLAAVASSEAGGGLYLDLPIGVHPQGYDTWRFADLFATGMSVGAPPDAFFQGGQNWGFPPIDPARSTMTGHEYFIAALRKLVRSAGVVRIDHVMALHRLYWIPEGMPADEGVYVRYPVDELYAIVTLEAHRSDTVVVGEDLGTVPRAVRDAMRRHGVLSTFVAQFEASDRADAAIDRPSSRSLACVNTHDTEMFAGFWEGLSEMRRRAILSFLSEEGFLDDEGDEPIGVVRGVLRFLAASDAGIVVASLEDLWGERRPQNLPGTTSDEEPNWRRRLKVSVERLAADRAITRILNDVATLRSEVA